MSNVYALLLSTINNLMLLASSSTDLASDIQVTKGSILLKDIIDLMVKFISIGGGLWLAWGLIVLAGGLKDKNGPALQSGIWQMVGGVLIMVSGGIIVSIIKVK